MFMENLNQKAKNSFILGVIALVFAFIMPVVAWVLAVISINLNKQANEGEDAQKAKIGLYLSIAAIVIGVVNAVVAFIGFMGLFSYLF